MRLLVDTHALLWEVLDDPRLSLPAQQIWDEPSNELLISPASLWEIAIKVSRGKLALSRSLPDFFDTEIAANRLTVLPILPAHAARVAALPHHHRDPFDRLIVAQALCESLPILSIDAVLDLYGIKRLW